MTGGTTGQPRPASRKPDLLSFLPPFVALLQQVHLDRYRSLFIATPIYHGFGLAALFIGLILGAELYVTPRFEAARACELIARHRVSVVTLVPLMLQRLLKQDVAAISCVQCFLTGGAHLQQPLAQAVLTRLGPVLFNLYGTSEAGFCVIGTPTLLQRKPYALGKPVPGVRVSIMRDPLPEENRPAVGQLCIRSAWSTRQQDWIETGDLAYQDAEGDIVLCGRVDDMIVSGGENVYPVELENVLAQHPEVAAVAVVGIPDAEFGQRLKAIVVGREGTAISPDALLSWLKLRVARYQMPAVIEVRTELPYTSLGKLDKKALR
jgi:fatty-acyl-CoA synthase